MGLAYLLLGLFKYVFLMVSKTYVMCTGLVCVYKMSSIYNVIHFYYENNITDGATDDDNNNNMICG